MNKKSILWILLESIFLIVFNVVFFTLGGTEHAASVWIAYGLIHFAYFMLLVTPFLIRNSSSASVFGFSIASISSTYFLVEFAVGLIFIFLRQDSFKLSLVVQLLIASVYAAILILHLIANENTADQIVRHESEVAFVTACAGQVKLLLGRSGDKKTDKTIEKVYDALRTSPARSYPDIKPIEDSIAAQVQQLSGAVSAQNRAAADQIANGLLASIQSRNQALQQRH